jgi:hypothetical protein
MSDGDERSDAERADGVPAALGASATLSFDTADATDERVRVRTLDDVGVELAVDLGAVCCEVVLDDDAATNLADRLRDCRSDHVDG